MRIASQLTGSSRPTRDIGIAPDRTFPGTQAVGRRRELLVSRFRSSGICPAGHLHPTLDQIERRKGTILRHPLPWWALFPGTRDQTEEFLVPNARLIAFLLASSVVDLAGAQNFDFFELEPNNSCQAGTAFTVASGVGGGQLAGSTDIDHFRIVVPELSVLTVTLGLENTTSDIGSVIEAWVATESGSDLAHRTLKYYSASVPMRAIVQPGPHCVRFEAKPGVAVMTKEYRLQASLDASIAAVGGLELEPNNTLAQADSIPGDGSPILAQLLTSADVDVFSIATSPGTDVQVDVDPEFSTGDSTSMQSWLLDSAGNVLSWRFIHNNQSVPKTLLARRPAGGDVFVALAGNDGVAAIEGYVTVNATVTASTGLLEAEPNGLPGFDYVAGPGLLRGQLSTSDDVDDFSMHLGPGVVQFVVDMENDDIDGTLFLLEIYNSSNDLLVSREVRSAVSAITINLGVASAGLHRMVIRGKPGFAVAQKYYSVVIPATDWSIFRDSFD